MGNSNETKSGNEGRTFFVYYLFWFTVCAFFYYKSIFTYKRKKEKIRKVIFISPFSLTSCLLWFGLIGGQLRAISLAYSNLTHDCASTMFIYIILYGDASTSWVSRRKARSRECPAEAPNQWANDSASGQKASSYVLLFE